MARKYEHLRYIEHNTSERWLCIVAEQGRGRNSSSSGGGGGTRITTTDGSWGFLRAFRLTFSSFKITATAVTNTARGKPQLPQRLLNFRQNNQKCEQRELFQTGTQQETAVLATLSNIRQEMSDTRSHQNASKHRPAVEVLQELYPTEIRKSLCCGPTNSNNKIKASS